MTEDFDKTGSAVAAAVQASQPTYELHSLGWKAFQQLCVSIAGELWGQTVQGFFESHDAGRDGAFYGSWSTQKGESYTGSFTVQSKSSSKKDKVLHLDDVADELEKAKALAAKGLADNYFLMTSARLTGASELKIREAFEALPGIKKCACFGVERISQLIAESPRLRMLVPRIYGLGDLSQILDERAQAQALEVLSALGDDLVKFVVTEAYQNAARAVVKHGFVLLLGEPACGKSTIAAALAVGALDEWKCRTFKVRDADDFVRHSNPHDPKQFFWVDDAFGATQLDFQSTVRWNATFPHVQAAIRRGARFVFTSRSYIYNSARSFLKSSALPVLNESQVVIEVERITKDEREQILYNHIRLGTQPEEFKGSIKPYLDWVAAHQDFGPEIARRLGNPAFTQKLEISWPRLENFVAHPMDLLREIIRTLDPNWRSAIALVFMRAGRLASPISLSSDEEAAIGLLGGSTSEIRNALNSLNGSLLIRVQEGGEFFWRYKHPTIRDAFAALVAEDRELLDIYIAGTPMLQLFQEVSCGDVGIDGVKVVVPRDRYATLLSRVLKFLDERSENKDAVNRYLARRVDRDFLSALLSARPQFLSSLHVHSYLYWVSDVDVIARLFEFGLLPEAVRQRHVATMRRLAVETPDSGFLEPNLKQMFTDVEFAETMEDVRKNLIDKLDDCISTWRDSHPSDEDPEDYFSALNTALEEYKTEFGTDVSVVNLVDAGFISIKRVIDELMEETPPRPDYEDVIGRAKPRVQEQGTRSTFDDVDAQ
jgi:hypothetical protein